MKLRRIATFFATWGFISGFVYFAARIAYSHPHFPSVSQLVGHILTSVPIVGTHWLNLLKLRNPESKVPRVLLIPLNVFMLVLFIEGIMYLRSTGCGPLKLATFTLVWLVPFAATSVYFIVFASKPRTVS